MPGYTTFEVPYKITGPDGTVKFIGAGKQLTPVEVTNAEASATLAQGEAARIDSTNSVIPRWDYVVGDLPIAAEVEKVLRVSAAANVNWVGVAVQDIPAGKQGIVAATPSTVCVKCASSPTSTTLGAHAMGSANAGQVDFVGPNAAGSATLAPAGGTVLGRLVKQPGTSAGQTGSATQGGIIVGHP